METSVEQLIKERTFTSLTGEELAQVKELCETEEEFQTMKLFFQELENVAASRKTIINPEIKNSLDGIFSAKHPGLRANWTAPEVASAPVAPVIPLHQRTWVRIAAAAILILGTAPFWGLLKNELPSADTTTAQVQKSKPDSAAKPETRSKAPETGSFKNQQTYQVIPGEEAVPQETGVNADEPASMSGGYYAYEWSAPEAAYAKRAETATDTGLLKPEALTYSLTSATPSGAVTGSSVQLGNAGFAYSFNTTVASTPLTTFSSVGRNADLHPNSGYMDGAGITAQSLAEQPDDLLDLLVPAF